MGGVAAFIRSVSNVEGIEEVIVQTPCGASLGLAEVVATVQGVTGRVGGVDVADFQPGVFEVIDAGGVKVAWALHGDGSAVNLASPAVRGEVVRVCATGLGLAIAVDPPAKPEQLFRGTLVLGINDAGVPVLRSGYLNSQPGLYFVEVAIPADLAARNGAAAFVIAVRVDGSSDSIYSNTVAIPVR